MFISHDDMYCVNGSFSPTVLQEIGMYAVVALDPVASVRFLDPEAAAAARELKTKRYLALIRPRSGWFDASLTPCYKLDVYFVGQGKPNDPVVPIGDSMSVPIHPAINHPKSRPPVHPSQPLPWSDCYQYTLALSYLSLSGRIFPTDKACTTVPESDIERLRAFINADKAQYFKMRANAAAESFPSEDPSFDSESSDAASSMDQGESYATASQSGGDIEDIISIPQGIYPTFDIWLDFGLLEGVPDPSGAAEELCRLYGLQADCVKRQRMKYKAFKEQQKENASRLESWAQGLSHDETDIEEETRKNGEETTEANLASEMPNQTQESRLWTNDSAIIDAKTTHSTPTEKSGFRRATTTCLAKLRRTYTKSLIWVRRLVVRREKIPEHLDEKQEEAETT